ncbi:MAG: precorrin-6A/cobalt-precorrin-6A reductase, partial [Desulfotomaculales bacterium]
MILVLAGTTEGREIFSLCRARGYPVLATVATPYGKRVLLEEAVPFAGAGETEIVCAPLDRQEMAALIRERGIRVVVDASHPFAVFASENARGACADTGAA